MAGSSNRSNSLQNSFGNFLLPPEFQEVVPLDKVESAAIKSFNFVGSTQTLGFEDIAKVIDEKYREVRKAMITLVASFHEEFPSSVGLRGAYSLVLSNCGNPNCQMCPHSIRWRRFDCVRKNPYLDTVENAAKGQNSPDLRMYTAAIQKTTSIDSEFLVGGNTGRGRGGRRNHSGRRTVVLFHPTRYEYLPGAFHKKHQKSDKKYYPRFYWYNNEVKRLNKIRARLGKMKAEMGYWFKSITQNKDFKNEE